MWTMYDKLARLYDKVIGAMDYGSWSQDLINIIKKYNPGAKSLLDVGCGTGNHLVYFEKEFETEGFDFSHEMIEVAKSKLNHTQISVQDMKTFKIEKQFDAITCLYDSLNNIEEKDLNQVFQNINQSLKKGGIFIFDVLTLHAMEIMNDFQIQAGHVGDDSFIWENSYKNKKWTWTFTSFLKEDNGAYGRYSDSNTEHFLSQDAIDDALKNTGFLILEMHDAYTLNPLEDESERINFVCKKVN